MKRIVIILFLVSICYGTPFVLLLEADVYTSHQLPLNDSTLDIGSALLFWRYLYGDAFTDGTALWSDSNLSGFTSISGLTLTDTILNINAGSITSAVNGTFSGTLIGNILTDGTFIVTGGIVTAGTWHGDTITVPYGGTGATTLTDGGLLLGSGTGAITALGVAANGQIPIGDGTTDPVLALITGGTNLTSVPGAGSITLNVDDAFLINDGDDTTTGTITAAGFTTTGTVDTGVLIVDTDTLVANVTGYADKVGIGTALIGDEGWAKLQIKGADSGDAGPHLVFETDADVYPLMQILPYSHDNINIYFDSYYSTASSKSSDVGSNALIKKGGDILNFMYDSGIAQGNDITWNYAMTIDLIDGDIGMGTITPNAHFQNVGDTHLGADTTHYTEFTTRGAMSMHGDSRVIRHIVIGAPSWKLGATAPTQTYENIFATISFNTGQDDEAHYTSWVPSRWDDTTDMEVHVHWQMPDDTDNGNVFWKLKYIGVKEGEDPAGAGTEITQLSAGNHPQDEIIDTVFGTKILAANLEREDDLGLMLWRHGTDASDDCGEDAELIAVHIHYTMNQLGEPLLAPVTDVLLLDDGASKLLLDDGASFMLIRI